MKLLCCLGTLILCALQGVGAEEGVDRKPLAIQSYLDMGQIVSGSNLRDNSDQPGAIKAELLQRTSVSLTQEVVVQNRLDIKIGVGGLFWYPWPALPESPYTRSVKFGPGISTASGIFKFGDVDKPKVVAQFGYFAYKYNPDAMDLGEYLFRSTAYPSLIYTGGWSFINSEATKSASNKTTGLRLGFANLNGALNNDVGLFVESNVFPFNSISPAWVGSLKLGKSLEIGAGAVWQHLIAMQPSQLSPHEPLSTYVEVSDFPAIAADTTRATVNGQDNVLVTNYRAHPGGAIQGIEQEIMTMKDANGNNPYDAITNAKGDTVKYVVDPNAQVDSGYHFLYPRTKEYLTFRGIKVMGRFALDFKSLLGVGNGMNPQDLRLFGEAAILGVQNQPGYYEKISQRIPVMLGFNLPTFKLLDLLSVQMEYFDTPYLDSEEKSYNNNLPVPAVPNSIVRNQDAFHNPDKLKWSVYAKRNLFQSLNLYCQVASDHMRLVEYTGDRNWQPVVNHPSEWYYLFRLEFSI